MSGGTTMKFCKGCVHADTTSKEPKYWKCRAPEVVRIITDLVTGETITLDQYCELQREGTTSKHCGASGQWFSVRKQEAAE